MTARPTKFFAVLLAALLGASGGVASLAACPHATREAPAQDATHECCRAHHAHADSRDAGAAHAHHEPAHARAQGGQEVSRRQSHEAGCAAHPGRASASVASQVDSDAPCADCCAPRLPGANAPTVAPVRNASRADDADDATASQKATLATPRHYQFTPTQHAPPAPRARLHVLNSVLLI